jgi:hypothetical protein
VNAARYKVDEEGCCRACGALYPEAAHLWPRSLGAPRFDTPDLIMPLCRQCHTSYDAHELNLLPLVEPHELLAVVAEAGTLARATSRLRGLGTAGL